MSDNETQADILAKMRRHVQAARDYPQDIDITDGDVEDWADRIEAAATRERIQRDKVSFRCGDCARFGGDCDAGDSDGNEDRVACEEFVRRALVPGDAAALREALIKIRNEIRSYCYDYGAGESHKSLVDRILDDPPDYTCYRDSILEIDGIVDAALAKPARNCDRFRTSDEVSAYWAANVHAVPLHGDAYAMRIDGREFATFLDWLFATAEGGAR